MVSLEGDDVLNLKRLKSNRGQAIVELAILLPVLLLILMAILEFGRVFNAYMIITHASREGARAGSVGGSDIEIAEAIGDTTPTLDPTNMRITVSTPSGRDRGDPLTVTVEYDVDLIVPLIGNVVGDPVELDAATTIRIE